MRRAFQVVDRHIPLGFQLLVGNAGHYPRTGAVTAVGGASVGDQKENSIRVAVHQTRDRHVRVFPTRIRHLRGIGVGFFDAGNDLPPNGTVRIGGVNEVKIVRRDRSGQFGAREENSGALFVAEGEVLFDLLEFGDPVLELPLGGIPVAGRDVFVRPISGGRGGKGDVAQNWGEFMTESDLVKEGSPGGEVLKTKPPVL